MIQHKQDANMPQRAYNYRRYSDPTRQRDGDSMRRQEDWADDICRDQGWILDDTLTLEDRGKSAFHGHNRRPTAALSRFLELIQRGRITPRSILVIEQIDRLSRQDVDTAHDLFRSIIRAGVWICTRIPFRIYKGEKDASFIDLLEPIWIMYCAHMESVKKSERVTEAWKSARRRTREQGTAHQATPPWWVRRTGDRYELDPTPAATMRYACQLLCEGLGFYATIQRLTTEGYPGPSRSKRWTVSGLAAAVGRGALTGHYQPHNTIDGKRVPDGPLLPDFYPALLTPADYLRLTAAIATRKNKRGRPATNHENLFTGIVRHATTKLPMSLRSKGYSKTGQRYSYLQAQDQRTATTTVCYDQFETCVLDTLAMLRPQDVLDPSVSTNAKELRIAELNGRQTALEHRQRQLQADAADPDKDYLLPVLAQVSSELKAVAKERETLQLQTLSGRAEALAEVQTLHQLRAQAQGQERLELDRRIKNTIPTVVDSIWVYIQPVTAQTKIVHIQIFLRSGTSRYVRIEPPNLSGTQSLELRNIDLRKEDVSNITDDTICPKPVG